MSSNQTINSLTTFYGVFGSPISHSRSPLMLNRAFQENGINAAYAAFHIEQGTLKAAIDGIRALRFRGVNVTIPYKVEVMSYLDEIDEGARVIGAVNTIVNENGKLIGYNTDGIGYVRSLCEETGISLQGKRVLLLGAGGAGRGIAYALAKAGAEIVWVSNRTESKANELVSYISLLTEAKYIAAEAIAGIIDKVDLVVNNTSLGMYPNINEIPLDPSLLHDKLVVSDIIYTPMETLFLKEARARGAKTHGGLGMFIYQGAYAFEYWTGQNAPIQAMREIVLQSLTE
ncbi:shikimate dehydrogenase [Paenibacillus psychroresistens]|uniref:Shikimate dehydrogenase (NADP(+)) n=1 Tax=Paenibacillus psychroresistens TaxID=1778678 RepID=A0A6B8RJA7_9BACL|nr:shikimate dehydrogenase [Paenibacillus psychroresistens]QGQ95672.1 shikimate dehydrogenase [Paenibacillus psychroresistens]